MKLYYSDHISVPLPEGHRFPMPKYARLRRAVEEAGLVHADDLRPSPPATDEQILRVHLPSYWNRMVLGEMTEKEMRRIGFPWSPNLAHRARHTAGGTIAACRSAIQEGLAANLAGGTHHAFPDHGEGYCVLNDSAIAARAVQAEGMAKQVVILDCDVHQGNGTAAAFANDPTIFTFSVHGKNNFPFHKEFSDLDVGLPDGSDDRIFLEAVRYGLNISLKAARADLAIYIAGADPYAGDQLGRMAVTRAGLAERDRLVLEHCRSAGLPVAIVMGGGYARQVEDTVAIHMQTIRIAVERFDQEIIGNLVQ